MSSLRETLAEAEQNHTAVGHFNVSDLVTLRAVFETARGLNLPVLVGVSEGEREFMGVRQTAAVVQSIRNEYGSPIFLNADHTHTLAKAVEAATAGFDAIVFDNSTLPLPKIWTRPGRPSQPRKPSTRKSRRTRSSQGHSTR
ncbi:MAG: class II fructose-bisphosphate aldolase [Acidobacteriia bacterium]|nr:class II fructose-bisphosphate aldolase [Terriglobia bacterium]